MAITFPRAMPESLPFRALTFKPYYTQLRAPTRGGRVQVANIAPDLWHMSYETPPLRQADAEWWEAWIMSLRGGARLFKALHPLKRFARAYPNGYVGMTRAGGGAFDGTATLSVIAETLDAVTLTGLPAGFQLGTGDLLSFPMDDGALQALHRVIEGGAASGGGGIVVTVEPTIALAAVTGVTVALADPWCKASIDPASISAPWQVGRLCPLRFSAMQQF